MEKPAKPKLLYLITKSNYGGAQRYVHELAVHFQQTYEVVVACGGNGLLVEKLKAAGIRTVEIKHFQRDISLLKEWRAARELWRLFKTEQPDIIHLNSSKAGLLGAVIGRLTRMPYIIFTIHGWAFHEPRPRWWKMATWLGGYLTVLLSHRSIPISNYDVAHGHLYGLGSRLTPVIYNGVAEETLLSMDEARAALVPEDTCIVHQRDTWVITIAELHPKKNHRIAIDAVIAHNTNPDRKHNLFYVIVGDGILRDELESYVLAHHASAYIYLCGFVTDAKRYLLAGDIFLLPSKQEGLPFALLEAGAAGLPTIASNVCGIPEVITDKTHGFLFSPTDTEALTEALFIMSHQPLTRATYSTVFREHISSHFTLEKTLSAVADVYDRGRNETLR